MRQIFLRSAVMMIFVCVFCACSTVPITGRKQLNIIPAGEMLSMSYQQYREFLSTNKVSTHPSDATRIENIQRLLPEMTQYKKK